MGIFGFALAALSGPTALTNYCNDFLRGGRPTLDAQASAVQRATDALMWPEALADKEAETEVFEPDELWRPDAPVFCGTVSHTPWDSTYVCDQPAGHVPADEHASGAVKWSMSEDVPEQPLASAPGSVGPRIQPPGCAGEAEMSAPYIPFNHEWSPKSLREKLCIQQTHIPPGYLEKVTRAYFGELIRILDLHRPLGNDGKHGATGGHGNLCTPTCGCEDK